MFWRNYGLAIRFAMMFGSLTVSTANAQTDGNHSIQNSLNVLLAAKNVSCDIRITIIVNGKEYSAKGHYAEQALPHVNPNFFLRSVYRLDIDFHIISSRTNNAEPNHEPNRMILVCYTADNGNVHQLDRYISIEGNRSYTTVDLKRLEYRLRSASREHFFRQVSEVRNLGGLAGMMRQIHRFYEFSPPIQDNLQDERAIPALKLTGTLRGIYRKELLTQFGGLNKQGHYPADFPSDVEVWIGMHDGFPYQIRYLRRPSEKSSQQELLFQETFHNVVLNGPLLPDSRFAPLRLPEGIFSPEDDTDNFIRSLGL